MISPPKAPKYKNPATTKKWLLGCFLIGPLVCCGGPALFARKWVDTFDYSADLDTQIAAAKKAGMPFVRQDLKRSPALAENENSFSLALRVLKDFPEATELTSKARQDEEPIPEKLKSLISRSQAIARRKGFDGNKDMDKGFLELYPEYLPLKSCARALAIQATHEAALGHADSAIENLRLGRALALQLDDQQILIGVLVRISMMQVYYRAVSKVIGHFENNHDVLERLRTLLKEPVHEVDRTLFLKGEYYYALSFTRNFKAFGGLKALSGGKDLPTAVNERRLRRTGLPDGALERGMLGSFIKHYLEIYTIYNQEPNIAKAGKKADLYATKVPMTTSNSLLIAMLPVLAPAGVAWEKQKLCPPILIASIDLIEHRKGGEFPGEIPDIADPLAGGTLNYHRTGGGFIIYSSGENGKDDGGPKNYTDRKSSDDFGFEYPFLLKK